MVPVVTVAHRPGLIGAGSLRAPYHNGRNGRKVGKGLPRIMMYRSKYLYS